MATPEPYQALVKRMNAIMDEMEALLAQPHPRRIMPSPRPGRRPFLCGGSIHVRDRQRRCGSFSTPPGRGSPSRRTVRTRSRCCSSCMADRASTIGDAFYFDRFADIAQVVYLDHRGNNPLTAAARRRSLALDAGAVGRRHFRLLRGARHQKRRSSSASPSAAWWRRPTPPGIRDTPAPSSSPRPPRGCGSTTCWTASEALGGTRAHMPPPPSGPMAATGHRALFPRLQSALQHAAARGSGGARRRLPLGRLPAFPLPAGEIWRMDLRSGLAGGPGARRWC